MPVSVGRSLGEPAFILRLMEVTQSIYRLLKGILLILEQGDRRLLDRYNLTPARYRALVFLGERPGLSPSKLSDLLLCDKSNATRIVKTMRADGLVIRRPHETDGRAVRLFLSEAGEALRRQAIRAHERYYEQRFKELDPIALEQFEEDLLQMTRILSDPPWAD